MVRPCERAVAAEEVRSKRRRRRKSSRQGTSVGPARKMVVGCLGRSSAGELGVSICSCGERDIFAQLISGPG